LKESWSVKKIFHWSIDYFTKKNIPEPRLSTEILLAFVLKLDRLNLYINFDRPLNQNELKTYREVVERRLKKEPIEYITGYTDFWNIRLKITLDVLIPRKDTETLVEACLNLLKNCKKPYKLADIGCGSGALAISLASELKESFVFATDISEKALEISKENSKLNKVSDRIIFLKGDLLDPLSNETGFALIASNPPYISPDDPDIDESVKLFEPHTAFCSEKGALYFHKNLVDKACDLLDNGGHLALEIGFKQGKDVEEIFRNSSKYKDITIVKDYAGHDRVVYGRKA